MNQETETWLAGLPAQGRPAGGQPQRQEVADRAGREDVTGASRPLGLTVSPKARVPWVLTEKAERELAAWESVWTERELAARELGWI